MYSQDENESWKIEIRDIILWDLYLRNSINYKSHISDIFNTYHIAESDISSIIIHLREERLIRVEGTDTSFVTITERGRGYAEKTIKPSVEAIRSIDKRKVQRICSKSKFINDLQLNFSDSGFEILYFPLSKTSDFKFVVKRIANSFYHFNCVPWFEVYTRSDDKVILSGLERWLKELDGKIVPSFNKDSEQNSVNYFAAGSTWGREDQSSRFLSQGIWQHDHDRQLDEMLDIKLGDTIVLKSTSASKDNTKGRLLHVKGLGLVQSLWDSKDNRTIGVDWYYKGPPIEIEDLGQIYNSTLKRMETEHWNQISTRLNKENAQPMNENVSFQHDGLSERDMLGRSPFIEALYDYIEKLWSSPGKEPYMIHLDGEWGSGKSNALKFLGNRLKENDWIVVEYNAWQNQSIDPPWWVFMDTIYSAIKNQSSPRIRRLWISCQERYWRLVSLNKVNVFSLMLLVVLVALLIVNRKYFDTMFGGLFDNPERVKNTIEVILAVPTSLGIAWSFILWIKNSFVNSAHESAINLRKTASDPMRVIREHFEEIIKYPVKFKKQRPVAVFIDDLDRCNVQSVVKLLEGIQTLFKSTRLLYVVAGDGAWIKGCFELHYKEFSETVKGPGISLGDSFQEKIFQLSISMPKMTSSIVDSYFKDLLSGKETSVRENQERVNEIKSKVLASGTDKERGLQTVIESYQGTEDEALAIQIAVKEMSDTKTLDELKHKLEPYSAYLQPNPRSIKRFINNYALKRQALMIQGVSFNDVDFDLLVRWQIIVSKFPKIAGHISNDPDWLDRNASHDIFRNSDFNILVRGIDKKTVRLILGK